MTTFIVIGIAMTLATVALLAWPLLRHSAGPAPVAAVSIALVVPAAAILLYLTASNHAWQPGRAPVNEATQPVDMATAVQGLEQRLQREPGDLEGWLLLGRSYMQMQRPEDAQRAYGNALALTEGRNAAARLGFAEAEIFLDRESLAGEAGEMIEAVLAEEPDNAKALWYGGMVAMARGDADAVAARWQKLLELDPPPQVREVIEQQLASLGIAAGGSPAAPAGGAGGDAGIEVRVAIDDRYAGRIGPGAALFVIARDAAQQGGPPVAAVRGAAGDLPRTVRISDADAMLPGRSLAQLPEIRLVARISNSGTALPEAGDVFGEASWSPGQGPASIVMDQLVQP